MEQRVLVGEQQAIVKEKEEMLEQKEEVILAMNEHIANGMAHIARLTAEVGEANGGEDVAAMPEVGGRARTESRAESMFHEMFDGE